MSASVRGIGTIIRPLLGRTRPSDRCILVLVCYLDDSDHHEDPAIVMAGYLSNLDSWESFEAVARPYLDSYGVEYLTAKEFHNDKNFFKGWGLPKKVKFLTGLQSLFRPRVILGISEATYKNNFVSGKLETGFSPNQSPYGFSFNLVLNHLLKHHGVRKQFRKGADLSLVIEESTHINDSLVAAYKSLKKKYNLEKLKSISFADKKSTVAINMADMIAFYSRRHVTAIHNSKTQNSDDVEKDPMLKILMSGITHIGTAATDFFASDDESAAQS